MDEIWEGLGGIVVIGLLIYGGIHLYQYFINKPFSEVNGTVKYDDCREKITLNSTDYKTQDGTFLCNDSKTNSGKSMGGECIKTISDSSGKCQTAYIYEKPPEETCGTNSYLTVDDKCSCGYGYVMRGESCISNNEDCQNKFGPNSYGTAVEWNNTPNTSTCYCNTGYFMNSDKTYCLAY